MISSFLHLNNSTYTYVGESKKGISFLLGKDASLFFHVLSRQIKVNGTFEIDGKDVLEGSFRIGLISFDIGSHVLISDNSPLPNKDIEDMVASYCNENELSSQSKDKLIKFALDIYSCLKEKPLYLLIDLSSSDIGLYPHLLHLVSSLYPSYPIFLLPRDYSRDISISFSSTLEEINETKQFYIDEQKKAEVVGFKAFVDDFCEIKKIVPGSLFQEEAPKEEMKKEAKEKKPVSKFSFHLSKEDKSDLGNIGFCFVFFALAASTGPIFFAFSSPEVGWMFIATLIMDIVFTFMSSVPTGYIAEDRKSFNFKKEKYLGFAGIFFPILSIAYGVGLLIICKDKGFELAKILAYSITYMCYPVFEVLNFLHTYYKLKKKSKKAK